MNSKAHIVGVIFLAIFLAALAGGTVVGGLPYHAEDPLAEEDPWDEDVFPTTGHSSFSFCFDSFRSSSLSSFTPEPRDQSGLFLLEHSLRC